MFFSNVNYEQLSSLETDDQKLILECAHEHWHFALCDFSKYMFQLNQCSCVVLVVQTKIVAAAVVESLCSVGHNATFFSAIEFLADGKYDEHIAQDFIESYRSISAKNISALFSLTNKDYNRDPILIVTDIASFYSNTISKASLMNSKFSIKKGESISIDSICNKLVSIGYLHSSIVTEEGEFARRGGIVDVFSTINKHPVRLDLFGNEVESIRAFSVESQRTINEVDAVDIVVASEYADILEYSDATVDKKLELSIFSDYVADALKTCVVVDSSVDCDALKDIPNKIIITDFNKDLSTHSNSECILQFSSEKLTPEALMMKKSQRKKKKAKVNSFVDIASGDFVIHSSFGIGKYCSCIHVTVNESVHDCVLIEYLDGDKLYVPVENLELVSKYADSDAVVVLDKLGSSAWNLRKAKIKNRITEVADALLRLSAERALKVSDFFVVIDEKYEDFCKRFPYVETDDQLNAICDVIDDLKSTSMMDRLVCGDVGFGKTEVALRAAYLVASAGKQVAIVTPTTLLCRQHIDVFKKRFENLPFTIYELSRMVSPKNARIVKEAMESGEAHIIIGTQSLFANSIRFKNLGLIIIDEEQHFGVKQKEVLKQSSSDTHVLTLSATPIPRTLQFALNGVKTMSLIASPPIDRKTITTLIMDFNIDTVKKAIDFEIQRGGQVFIVAPRLENLSELQKMLEAEYGKNIVVAHGKLPVSILESTICDFINKKYNILISTNIIESGIDIPSANTIIVYRSDLFGLAQLYQLRGRVGRSSVAAFAYFTVANHKKISVSAVKRLRTIKALDKLGASFSVATSDMDIRGAGNALGEEQSGNIKEVGFELYQKMLYEAISILKNSGDVHCVDWSVQLNLGLSMFIPHTYIEDISLRLLVYKKISDADTKEELHDISHELVDRFGGMPQELKNLVDATAIKIVCKQMMVEKIDAGHKGITLSIKDVANDRINVEKLQEFINKYNCKIRENNKIFIPQQINSSNVIKKINSIFMILKKFEIFLFFAIFLARML